MFDSDTRPRLASGRPVFGTFLKMNAPVVVELIGMAGFDFVVIDREHGCFTDEQVENLIRTADLMRIGAIVRTPDARETGILHALDSGALGVQVPSLHTAHAAEEVVRFAKYHPIGQRGFARINRSAAYGSLPLPEYFRRANETLVVVHVENQAMVNDIEALCSIDAVDVLFLGLADLSQSLGVPGANDHPLVASAMDRVVQVATAAGRSIGAVASSPRELELLVDRGINYILWQSDIAMLRDTLKISAQLFEGHR